MTDTNLSDPRQLIICCDGTNNTLTAGRRDTHVLRLMTHLARHPSAQRQLYYDPGVGTADAVPPTGPIDWAQRSWERISGLASGRGVYDNIAQAYLFLMHHWRDDADRIYCFGFSRGAFTVRCVAGMVNLFGILRPEHEVLLPTLIRIYFAQPGRPTSRLQAVTRRVFRAVQEVGATGVDGAAAGGVPGRVPEHVPARVAGHLNGHVNGPGSDHSTGYVTREQLAEQIRTLFTSPAGRDAWVHWVGVWDTVESVGLPGPLARRNPSSATLLGKRIRHVRHALAFDEHRWTFAPRLYEVAGDLNDANTGQTLRQRWFPGAHCDVGGSYSSAVAGLSDDTFDWMLAEVAGDLGVPPESPPGQLPGHPLGQPNEPVTHCAKRVRHDALWAIPWWALAGMCLRDLQARTPTGELIQVIPGPQADPRSTTVWRTRRKAWPVGVALLIGALCLLLSGACLLPGGWRELASVSGAGRAFDAASAFASDQLAALWGAGLLAAGAAPWRSEIQAGWAMVFDLGFIASWGYLLARVASRAFVWMAGQRHPGSRLPAWRVLGMAPLLAVGGDVSEDLLTLAALAAHGVGTDLLAQLCLWLGAVGAVCKWAGLGACVPLLAVRCWNALPGVRRSRS